MLGLTVTDHTALRQSCGPGCVQDRIDVAIVRRYRRDGLRLGHQLVEPDELQPLDLVPSLVTVDQYN